jgi:hypothetical protein
MRRLQAVNQRAHKAVEEPPYSYQERLIPWAAWFVSYLRNGHCPKDKVVK